MFQQTMRNLTCLALAMLSFGAAGCAADSETLDEDQALGAEEDQVDTADEALSSAQQALFSEINKARSKRVRCSDGRSYGPSPALRWNGDAATAARAEVTANANSGSSSIFHVDAPYAANLAAGYPDARSAVEGWLKSTSGHCPNLMNAGYRIVGVSHKYKEDSYYKYYWAMKMR